VQAPWQGRLDRLLAPALGVGSAARFLRSTGERTALPVPGSGCSRSRACARTGSTRPRCREECANDGALLSSPFAWTRC
jgi:hypothetical protein